MTNSELLVSLVSLLKITNYPKSEVWQKHNETVMKLLYELQSRARERS